jgi:uncharacterized protein (TIGR03083 family)
MQVAGRIPKLGHREAGALATRELERTLSVVANLRREDWERPTACTAWDVRELVAHLAGACAGYASWSEFRRQYLRNPYIREASMSIDGINRRQVEDRAGATPQQLIDELRMAGPKAIRVRQRIPWPLRALRVPFGPPLGFAPVGYLTDVIYIRDMWMHRLDICRATGQPFVQSPGHDGRIVALVVRDLNRNLQKMLAGQAVLFVLDGPAGGVFRVGARVSEKAAIRMDVLDFNLLASGRLSPNDAIAQELAVVDGNVALADAVINNTGVVY